MSWCVWSTSVYGCLIICLDVFGVLCMVLHTWRRCCGSVFYTALCFNHQMSWCVWSTSVYGCLRINVFLCVFGVYILYFYTCQRHCVESCAVLSLQHGRAYWCVWTNSGCVRKRTTHSRVDTLVHVDVHVDVCMLMFMLVCVVCLCAVYLMCLIRRMTTHDTVEHVDVCGTHSVRVYTTTTPNGKTLWLLPGGDLSQLDTSGTLIGLF